VGEHGVEDRTDRGRLVAGRDDDRDGGLDFRLMTRSRLNSSRLSVHGTSGCSFVRGYGTNREFELDTDCAVGEN